MDNRYIEESEQNIWLMNKNPALDDDLDNFNFVVSLPVIISNKKIM